MAVERRLRHIEVAAAAISVAGQSRQPRQGRRRRHRLAYRYRRRTFWLHQLDDATVRHLPQFSKREI